MRFRILCLTAAAMLATGCTTVNVAEIATPAAAKAQVVPEKDIVLRAASKLYAAFQSKGFVAETSREKMQSAASVLLNGLEERALTSETDYAAQDYSYSVVMDDITFATQHVRQTANAAEIYFELSEGRKKLREELVSLESALLSSREASLSFGEVVGTESSQFQILKSEVDRLKRVTDKFGQRVRQRTAADAAARRGEVI